MIPCNIVLWFACNTPLLTVRPTKVTEISPTQLRSNQLLANVSVTVTTINLLECAFTKGNYPLTTSIRLPYCLSMGELVSLTKCGVFAMLLRVYVDDSSDERQEKAVVAGAFVGTAKQWSGLKLSWQRRLKQDGLRYFRSTEYYSLRGEFARYRDSVKYPKPAGSNAATALRDDLDGVIKKSGVMGMAVAIPMKMYKHIRETEFGAKEIFSEDAFESALQSLINQCAMTSREEFNGIPLAFICDDSPSSARIAKTYGEFKALNTEVSQYLGGLVHQDDKYFPQLQAADLMAHLAKEM